MNFINNWMQPVTLAAGIDALELALQDGTYRLSIADSPAAPTRWEIIGATVSGGVASLQRGLEGTLDQDWPEGSIIYAGVTAGMLGEIYQRISELEQRVTILEQAAAPGIPVEATLRSAQFGSNYNYYANVTNGGLSPSSITLPDGLVAALGYIGYGTFFSTFEVRFATGVDAQAVADQLSSLSVQGIGSLELSAAIVTAEDANGPGSLRWEGIPDSDWSELGTRTVRFITI